MKRYPARKDKFKTGVLYMILLPLILVHCDLLKVRVADVMGNLWLLATLDHGIKYPRVAPIPDKRAETVWKAFMKLHPGSRGADTVS